MKYFEAREGKLHCTELICMVNTMRRTNPLESLKLPCGAPLESAKKIQPVLQTRDLRAWTNDEVSSTSLLCSTQYRWHFSL